MLSCEKCSFKCGEGQCKLYPEGLKEVRGRDFCYYFDEIVPENVFGLGEKKVEPELETKSIKIGDTPATIPGNGGYWQWVPYYPSQTQPGTTWPGTSGSWWYTTSPNTSSGTYTVPSISTGTITTASPYDHTHSVTMPSTTNHTHSVTMPTGVSQTATSADHTHGIIMDTANKILANRGIEATN